MPAKRKQKDFCHLHVHSEFSMLDGLGTIEEYVARAKQLGMSALALTDHGVLLGIPIFYKECRKNGIEPVAGCEFYYVDDVTYRPEKGGAQPERFHLILLARDHAGYEVLTRLNTIAAQNYYYKPVIDRNILASLSDEERESVVALSGCASSRLSEFIRAEKMDEAAEELMWWREMFPHYYIELQHHDTEFDCHLTEGLIELAKRYEVPMVVTNDPHYVVKRDAQHHDALLAIQVAKDIDDPNRFRFDGHGYHLRSRLEMRRAFRRYGDEVWREAARNTLRIARLCHTRIPQWEKREWQIPVYPDVPKGTTSFRYLRGLVTLRLAELDLANTPAYADQARTELAVIKDTGIADFLLITMDCIQFARSVGIPVGPGRGSVCGSLVAYLIGIHNIDPIRYNLLFERFLNPARPSMPDIDTDFGKERRGEMFEYVTEKYGAENVVHVCTYGTMKLKKAFGSLASVYGIDFANRMRLTKLIEQDEEDESQFTLPDEVEQNYPALHAQLQRLAGTKCQISAHPAGVIIAAPEVKLADQVPLMYIASSKRFVGQYDLYAAEATGLMKQDFLGLRALDTVAEAVRLIEVRTGDRLDPDSWVPDEEPEDKAVYKMCRQGDTEGVFQFEGFCLPIDAPVLTPAGWTPIAKLKPGDSIVDPTGDISKVEELYIKLPEQVYEVKLTDGSCVEATEDHLWRVKLMHTADDGKEVTVSTKVLSHLLVRGHRPVMVGITPPDLSSDGPREIHPYVLGVLLGDGGVSTHQVRINCDDPEIVNHLRTLMPDNCWIKKIGRLEHVVQTIDERHNDLKAMLNRLGLMGKRSYEKWVPHHYLWSDVVSRLELLRGLMDTDGSIDSQGRMEFSSTSYQLIEAVTFLVKSLGGKCSDPYHRPAHTKIVVSGNPSHCRESWVIKNIRFHNQAIVPFRLSRKANRCRAGRWIKGWHIASITPTRVTSVACIAVSAKSRMYITKDWIPTHNTNRRGCKAVQPRHFEDLVSITALYRTGPIKAGYPARFIESRKAGKITWAHPALEDFLGLTWGVILYQEQVMDIAHRLAGFDMAGVDDIKNAIKHKDGPGLLAMEPEFMKGCATAGIIPKAVAAELWAAIREYSGYNYNRSHAVAYTMLSYQTARLSALHPVEFFAALLATVPPSKDNEEKRTSYLQTIIKRGYVVLPPHINLSGQRAMPNRSGNAVRFGFSDLTGIGDSAANKIVAGRPEGGYTSVDEVSKAVNNTGVMKVLTESNTLARLGVGGDKSVRDELLRWQISDEMLPYREKYAEYLNPPEDAFDVDDVTIIGRVLSKTAGRTKAGDKQYQTWKVSMSQTQIYNVRLWSETARVWQTPVGSIVLINGRFEPRWDNLSVASASQVKVVSRAA